MTLKVSTRYCSGARQGLGR